MEWNLPLISTREEVVGDGSSQAPTHVAFNYGLYLSFSSDRTTNVCIIPRQTHAGEKKKKKKWHQKKKKRQSSWNEFRSFWWLKRFPQFLTPQCVFIFPIQSGLERRRRRSRSSDRNFLTSFAATMRSQENWHPTLKLNFLPRIVSTQPSVSLCSSSTSSPP